MHIIEIRVYVYLICVEPRVQYFLAFCTPAFGVLLHSLNNKSSLP